MKKLLSFTSKDMVSKRVKNTSDLFFLQHVQSLNKQRMKEGNNQQERMNEVGLNHEK